MKSKIGTALVGVYFLFTVAVVIYATTCSGIFCGLVLVVPIVPWPFVLEGIIPYSHILYVVLAVLNGAILYFVGLLVSRLISAVKGKIK